MKMYHPLCQEPVIQIPFEKTIVFHGIENSIQYAVPAVYYIIYGFAHITGGVIYMKRRLRYGASAVIQLHILFKLYHPFPGKIFKTVGFSRNPLHGCDYIIIIAEDALPDQVIL